MIARWLHRRPALLDAAYRATLAGLLAAEPLLRRIGFARLAGLFVWAEHRLKGPLFDCHMCGMCILHSTGMMCPMSCPKSLRNGPCGGVRQDGGCEIKPGMPCIWVLAWERAAQLGQHGLEIHLLQPPVDRTLHRTSAWLNTLDGSDRVAPPGWIAVSAIGLHEHGDA